MAEQIPQWLLDKARDNPGLAADLKAATSPPHQTPYWDFGATRPIGAPNPGNESLVTAAIKATGLDKVFSDAIWAITNPLDRIAGRGRASEQRMEFVGPARSFTGYLKPVSSRVPRSQIEWTMERNTVAGKLFRDWFQEGKRLHRGVPKDEWMEKFFNQRISDWNRANPTRQIGTPTTSADPSAIR